MGENAGAGATRNIRDRDWYWVAKSVMREYASKIGPIPLSVYQFLASMTDANQCCFPSQKYIAEHLGCSRSSVNKAVRVLERHGMIRVDRRSRYHCVYSLLRLPVSNRKTQVSPFGNSDVRGEDTNNTERTILHNDTVSRHSSPDTNKPSDGSFPKTREELLAIDLAEGLRNPHGLNLYQSYAQRYPERLLRALLSEVKQVPEGRIKKSRGALFAYLLHRDAHGTK